MATIADLVQQTTTSTGTGALTLSHSSGFVDFNTAFGNGSAADVFYYYIYDTTNDAWERGTGHMSSSTSLVRDTLIASSTGSFISFGAGTKVVVCDLPASVQAG